MRLKNIFVYCLLLRVSQVESLDLTTSAYPHRLRPRGFLRLRGGSAVPPANPGSRSVTFKIRCQDTRWGQSVGLIGSDEALNNWISPIPMTCENTWPVWTVKVPVTCQTSKIEYKYVKTLEHKTIIEWEQGPNRYLDLPSGSQFLDMTTDDGTFGRPSIQESLLGIEKSRDFKVLSKISEIQQDNVLADAAADVTRAWTENIDKDLTESPLDGSNENISKAKLSEIRSEEEKKRIEKAKALAEADRVRQEQVAAAFAETQARAKAEEVAKAVARAKAEAEAKAAEEIKKSAADAERLKAEEAKEMAKAKAEAQAKADAEIRAEAEAKTKAEAEAKRKVEAEAEAECKRRSEAEAKQAAEAKAQAQKRAEAEVKAKAEAEAEQEEKASILNAGTKGRAKLQAEAKKPTDAAKAKAHSEAKTKSFFEEEPKAKEVNVQAKVATQPERQTADQVDAEAKAETIAKAVAKAKVNDAAAIEQAKRAEAKQASEAALELKETKVPENAKAAQVPKKSMVDSEQPPFSSAFTSQIAPEKEVDVQRTAETTESPVKNLNLAKETERGTSSPSISVSGMNTASQQPSKVDAKSMKEEADAAWKAKLQAQEEFLSIQREIEKQEQARLERVRQEDTAETDAIAKQMPETSNANQKKAEVGARSNEKELYESAAKANMSPVPQKPLSPKKDSAQAAGSVPSSKPADSPKKSAGHGERKLKTTVVPQKTEHRKAAGQVQAGSKPAGPA